MKFQYKIQPYQTQAVENTINVFKGQSYSNSLTYIRDLPENISFQNSFMKDELLGFKNTELELTKEEILKNIQQIQKLNNLNISKNLAKADAGDYSIDIEMETGTGKTYTYIKTIFELNKRYGWSKFIIVVPNIAIREGVKKSFQTTADHFMEEYGKKARYFIYDSKNLSQIDSFSKSSDINVMIINVQAFNSEGTGSKVARKIFTEMDQFDSRKPIDVIKANKPILILDEPQKMTGPNTKKKLKEFGALFTLNYSATHKDHHDLIYVLDALNAYNKKLVKKILVKGFDVKNLKGSDQYLYLDEIILSTKEPPKAKLEFEYNTANSIKRKTKIFDIGDSLYYASNELREYEGYIISEIDALNNTVTFLNGVTIKKGEVLGNTSEIDLRRIQIRETILSHFQKEEELFEKGIKVLSLFFIDEVKKYRKFNENHEEINSVYGEIFEEEYNSILQEYLKMSNTPYINYLKKISTSSTHAGYFSIDKKGKKIDGKINKKGESEDTAAYDLIMKDKERLLSLDNPVRFIFSHSALREGWDNPNIFQICILKPGGDSTIQKRQEVGRGLRLCVNQKGERMDLEALGSEIHEINELTVIASGGYHDFVNGLQQEISEDLYLRPQKASIDYFHGKVLHLDQGIIEISEKQAREIYHYLIKNEYIDTDDYITDKYYQELNNNTLAELPDKLRSIKNGVFLLINNTFNNNTLNEMISSGYSTKLSENSLNDNFYKKEFQKLWKTINHKYSYHVSFDSNELINKAIESINKELSVGESSYKITLGRQKDNISKDDLDNKNGFDSHSEKNKNFKRNYNTSIRYDLLGSIAKEVKLSRKTIANILSQIDSKKFDLFKINPEEFIKQVSRLIKEQKATMIVEYIEYNQIDESYDSDIFTSEKKKDFSKAIETKKAIQNYVFVDGYARKSKSTEHKFLESLEKAEEVEVYAKLPRGFHIPTPVGNYSPDWAIAFKEGTVKHIFFIAETKGSMSSLHLDKIEESKIACAKKLFNEVSTGNVIYNMVNSYEDLLNIMNKY